MTEIEQLLEPIAGENPAGQNLRYTLHAKIREARRFEEAGPRGLWEREIKEADYKEVARLGEEALIHGTKDLWVAAWLTDAWVYEYGVPGLTSGLQLLCGLLDRFWERLYPEMEDGEAEERIVPLDWVGTYFDPGKSSSPITALRRIPLSQSGYDWFGYQESRRIGYENEVRGTDGKAKRDAAIKEGKLTPEAFDKDFAATPKQLYSDLERDTKIALASLEELDAIATKRFDDVAPSFSPLREALKEFANLAHILYARKLEKEPPGTEKPANKPAEPANQPVKAEDITEAPSSPGPTAAQSLPLPELNGKLVTGEQAASLVIAAAQFIRETNPSSAVSYLLLRALRWGELRSGMPKGPGELPAPSSDTRLALRAAAEKKQWTHVLRIAEAAVTTVAGRGWLDVQRYSIKACEELGYADAAKALRSELKAYLHDFPQLVTTTMSDDTGTANPETLAWLRAESLIG